MMCPKIRGPKIHWFTFNIQVILAGQHFETCPCGPYVRYILIGKKRCAINMTWFKVLILDHPEAAKKRIQENEHLWLLWLTRSFWKHQQGAALWTLLPWPLTHPVLDSHERLSKPLLTLKTIQHLRFPIAFSTFGVLGIRGYRSNVLTTCLLHLQCLRSCCCHCC